jgi:peptide deformylase
MDMAILDIIIYPDPVLKEVSTEVTEFTPDVRGFIEDLVETMAASPGVGLAAVQVGTLKRIVAVDVTPRNPGHGLIVLVNPVLVSSSGQKTVREGCLSVPQFTADIKRATEVTIAGLDAGGNPVEITSTGFEAIALQHELDHLDGILFIDRIANMKRDLFKRKNFK